MEQSQGSSLRKGPAMDCQSGRRPNTSIRPQVESLENRWVPATITVNTLSDAIAVDGKVSLREAIQAANTNAAVNEAPAGTVGLDKIQFSLALLNKTIKLNSQLDITESVTIVGLGKDKLTISGQDLTRLFDINGDDKDIDVVFRNINLTHGSTTFNGGAINAHDFEFNEDSLGIYNCRLTDNVGGAEGGGENKGGAVYLDGGALTVHDSHFARNRSVATFGSGGEGAAINFDDSEGGGHVDIRRTVFNGNHADSHGGAVSLEGADGFIGSCVFTGNTAGQEGGALSITESNGESVTIQNTVMSGNTAAEGGGAIYNDANLTLRNCTLSGNTAHESGGGLYHQAGALTLVNTTISGNHADRDGGGLFLSGGFADDLDSVSITRCKIRGNTALFDGGGIFNETDMFVSDSTISGNTAGNGGGIFNYYGYATIFRSTISGNRAVGDELRPTEVALEGECGCGSGGGIFNDTGALLLANSTISGNNAKADGGGIFNYAYFYDEVSENVAEGAQTTLVNCTVTRNVAGNQGGGIFVETGSAGLFNTIVAANSAASGGRDLFNFDGFISAQFCLIQFDQAAVDDLGGNIFGQDPRLGPLQNNGGPTLTHAPLAGSPVINRGSNALAAGLTTDQRGGLRIFGGVVDIGAVEVQPFSEGRRWFRIH